MSSPVHLWSLEEFDRLPEDNSRRYELQDGILQMTPKAAPLHQRAAHALVVRLNAQLPPCWEAAADVEVALETGWPPTVRVPDAVITTPEAMETAESRLQASDVVVAIEIVSPGSRRTDRVTKVGDYAEAGIPRYWILDVDEPVTISAHGLVPGAMYEKYFEGSGVFKTTTPCELVVELPELIRSPTAR